MVPFAVVWIDPEDFSILKIRAYPESIKGIDRLLTSDKYDAGDVEIVDTHYYHHKRKGLRFPSSTEILLMYTYESPEKFSQQLKLTASARRLRTLKTTFTYDKYKFYSVTVDNPVIQQYEIEGRGMNQEWR